jgi:hypothetical protein
MKIYKSGKEYIVRTNIPSRAGKSILKIYDEDENDIPIENITENTKVMVILEIQGVRSSSCSFQIDIEIKQMMVLKPEEIFNRCIFKKKPEAPKMESVESLGNEQFPMKPIISVIPTLIPEPEPIEEPLSVPTEESLSEPNPEPMFVPILKEEPIQVSNENDLCEVDFDLEEMTDTICLKERKEMYYKMYEEARQKAKVARDLALSAYLEANRIKNKYMLDDVLDSSSDDESMDFDEEDNNDDE